MRRYTNLLYLNGHSASYAIGVISVFCCHTTLELALDGLAAIEARKLRTDQASGGLGDLIFTSRLNFVRSGISRRMKLSRRS